jgi:nucleoid DNA-binding protein
MPVGEEAAMTWHQYLRHVARRARLSIADTKRLLEAVRDSIPEAARDGGLRWPGLGTFDIATRKARCIKAPPGTPYEGRLMALPRTETLALRAAKAQKRVAQKGYGRTSGKGCGDSAEDE